MRSPRHLRDWLENQPQVMRSAFILLVVLVASGTVRADTEVVARLLGDWHGILESEGLGPQPITIRLERRGSALDIGLTIQGEPDEGGLGEEIALRPSAKPGVLEEVRSEGLFSLFQAKRSTNPLKGSRLIWARTAPTSFYLYILAMDDAGRFLLDRFAFGFNNGDLELDYERLSHRGERITGQANLQRAG